MSTQFKLVSVTNKKAEQYVENVNTVINLYLMTSGTVVHMIKTPVGKHRHTNSAKKFSLTDILQPPWVG